MVLTPTSLETERARRRAVAGEPRLSLVLPTYNESRNLPVVIPRIVATLEALDCSFEILVVDDDSPDRTWELAESIAAKEPRVRVVRRIGERGLASAVVAGWQHARGEVLGVMDADLQYPPESLRGLLAALDDPRVDVAIGSRWSPGAVIEEWSARRWLISRGARIVGRLALPTALRGIDDPGAGYFMVRRRVLDGVSLRPRGFKILIEVLARGHVQRVAEVGQRYEGRKEGQSKLKGQQVVEYLTHLLELSRDTGELSRSLRRAAGDLGGAAVFAAVASALVYRDRIPVPVAGLVAAEASILAASPARSAEEAPEAGSEPGLADWHARRAAGAAAGTLVLLAASQWLRQPALGAAVLAAGAAAATHVLVRRLWSRSPAAGGSRASGTPR
jgi:dolichol-phosphate mannosyltransferase